MFIVTSTPIGFRLQEFPINRTSDPGIPIFSQLASMVNELGGLLQLLTKQCSDCVLYPLTKFVHMDMIQLKELGGLYRQAGDGMFDRCEVKMWKCLFSFRPQAYRER